MVSCSTSPSAMVAAARDRIASTSRDPSSTINWNARANRKSPTRTDALLPNMALALASPRRSTLSSTTSSCSKVAVWMNSTQAASWTWRAPSYPHMRALANVSIGRSRLPPAATMWAASCGISATGLSIRAMIARLQACTSSPINADILARTSAPASPPMGLRTGCAAEGWRQAPNAENSGLLEWDM